MQTPRDCYGPDYGFGSSGVAGPAGEPNSHRCQSSPNNSTGCCVRSEPLPQASESAGQYLSHPQQIRCGLLGEMGNLLDTVTYHSNQLQAYILAPTRWLLLQGRIHHRQVQPQPPDSAARPIGDSGFKVGRRLTVSQENVRYMQNISLSRPGQALPQVAQRSTSGRRLAQWLHRDSFNAKRPSIALTAE